MPVCAYRGCLTGLYLRALREITITDWNNQNRELTKHTKKDKKR